MQINIALIFFRLERLVELILTKQKPLSKKTCECKAKYLHQPFFPQFFTAGSYSSPCGNIPFSKIERTKGAGRLCRVFQKAILITCPTSVAPSVRLLLYCCCTILSPKKLWGCKCAPKMRTVGCGRYDVYGGYLGYVDGIFLCISGLGGPLQICCNSDTQLDAL